MFAKSTTRRPRAERIAGQAWENLVAAVDSAGSTTKTAGRRAVGLLDDASDRMSSKVGSGTKEARKRANNAIDALAGRKQRLPIGWLVVAGIGGALAAWAATSFTSHRSDPPDFGSDTQL